MIDTTPTVGEERTTESKPHPARPLKICIASPDFIGLVPHGGAGIAYTAMAQALVAAGHEVTCLFLDAKDPCDRAWQRWAEKYKRDGLTLVALPEISASALVGPPHLRKSYEAYNWLKKNDRFDIIHFPDRQGPGYHTLTAKRQGIAFANSTICVGLHNMSAWLKAVDDEARETPPMDTDFMERRAMALADAVVSPSHYLLNCISNRHWELPRHCYVQQTLLPQAEWQMGPPVAPPLREIDELVYFGPLETRNGLTLFCDALDTLASAAIERIHNVTFLGAEGLIEGTPARAYIRNRAKRWSFPIEILPDYDEAWAIEYLRQKNRVAVIPSILETSPHAVAECLRAGVAFIASSVGGVPSLVAPTDVSKICFDPNARSLCAAIRKVLFEGMRPARPVVDARANEQAWIALHENLLARPNPPVAATVQDDSSAPHLSNETARSAIQALSIDPGNVVALKVLARIHLNAGLHEAAQEACQLILKQDPNDPEALQMTEEAAVQEAILTENLIDSTGTTRVWKKTCGPEPTQDSVPGLTAQFACP